MVFGGWDDGKITDAFFVKEEAPGKFSIHSEDECKLQMRIYSCIMGQSS